MALNIKHLKVSTIPDGTDPSLVLPSDWNADHALVGTADIAQGGTGATTAAGARTNLGVPADDGTGAIGSWAINITGTAEKSSNIAAGTALQIPVQGAPSVTTFVPAPTTAGQVLGYNGSALAWQTGTASGVTKILAGTNVTISPVGGTGDVTINATGGGGLTGTTQSVSPFETSLGFDAGLTNTGANNVYMGYAAGRLMAGATNNVVIGTQAMDAATIPANCVVIGNSANGTATAANQDVVIGASAHSLATTSGGDNVMVGYNAGNSVTGANNVLIGSATGNAGTTVTQAVGIGSGVFATITSVAAGAIGIGHNALGSLTSGVGNTVVGYLAGDGITTGTNNTIMGYQAGGNSITGANNVFIGFNAGTLSGNSLNTVIGASAGSTLSTGASNVFLGNGAGSAVTTGGGNVLIGGFTGTAASAGIVALSDGTGNIRQAFNANGALSFDNTNFGTANFVLQSNATAARPTWVNPNIKSFASVAVNTTIVATTSIYFASCATASITLTLPTAVGNGGLTISIKRTDSAVANTLSVTSAGGTIDGLATQSLGVSSAIIVASDGTNWYLLSSN